MRSLLLALAITALHTAVTQAAFSVSDDDQVIITQTRNDTNGGAFNAHVEGTDNAVDFKTFCVELTQHFTPGATYKVKLDDETSTGVQLKEEVAWLYSSFVNGLLGDQTQHSLQDAVQYAIWSLMGSSDTAIGGLSTQANRDQYDVWFEAIAPVWKSIADWQSHYGVQIMQLTDVDGNGEFQDQLVQIPTPDVTATPEPATLAIWGGLATLGLVAQVYRRKS